MYKNNIIKLLTVLFIILNSSAYGSFGTFDEDIELSKKIPLISGISQTFQDIREGRKAAITLCTIPLSGSVFSYDHVCLVFEIKHPVNNEINLFSVHFGGDGYSSEVKKGLPTIDSSYDTLRKIFRGKKTTILGFDYVEPLYSRKITFIVEKDKAIEAIKNIENEEGLTYSLPGWTYNIGGIGYNKCYNCCTYVNKILKDAGIDTGFDKDYLSVKNSSLLISKCKSYSEKENQIKHYPIKYYKYYSTLFQEENYKNLVNDLFIKAFNKDNYEDSLKFLSESARMGHYISQLFIGFLIYDNIKIKEDLGIYFNYMNKYQHRFDFSDEKSSFYILLINYDKFINSDYFNQSFKNIDKNNSFKWIKRAAKNSFPIAQGVLGYFYMLGKFTKIDKSMGIFYTKQAADKGDAIAAKYLCQ